MMPCVENEVILLNEKCQFPMNIDDLKILLKLKNVECTLDMLDNTRNLTFMEENYKFNQHVPAN